MNAVVDVAAIAGILVSIGLFAMCLAMLWFMATKRKR